jgi:hypothetical protein
MPTISWRAWRWINQTSPWSTSACPQPTRTSVNGLVIPIRALLNEIEGVYISDSRFQGRPPFPLAVLDDPESLARLITVVDRLAVTVAR